MSSIQGKGVLVIGGNGTLGSAAVEAAVSAGAKVTILSRRASSSRGAVAIQGSTTNPVEVRAAIEGVYGIVISVEANRSPEELQAVYVEGTRNVIEAASKDAQIVFISHIGITDIQRMPDYNRAKLKAEEIIRSSGLPYTIIRPAWVLSGKQRGAKFEQGDRYTGRRDDITTGDLGTAIVSALENFEARGKTFELYGSVKRIENWREQFALLSSDTTYPYSPSE